MNRLMLSAAFMMAAFVASAHAEQSVQFGEYAVHYNAFTSDVLDPKVAGSNGIQRSNNRGVLMVSVQRVGAPPSGVRATVSVTAQTKDQPPYAINMREVSEGDAYYYLSDFPVKNGQTLDFHITVQPQGMESANAFHYRQQFFTKGIKGEERQR